MAEITPDSSATLSLKPATGGRFPASRLDSVQGARSLFCLLRDVADRNRKAKARAIQAMLDGNPPYDASKLKALGQSWRPNFNSLEGKARKQAAKVPYYDLFTSSQVYAEVTTEVDGRLPAARASRILTEEFDRPIREWPGFEYNIWQMLDDFVAFGRGFLWWPHELTWRPVRVPWHRVRFPDATSIDTDEWEVFTIEHAFPVERLASFIRDREAAEAAGWRVPQVLKAISRATPKTDSDTDQMDAQRTIRDADASTGTRSATVQAADIFVREFDGSWTRVLVEFDVKDAEGESRDDFLLKATNVGETAHQILAPFFFDVEDGSINGLSGIGKDMFSLIQAKERMRNEQVANVFMRSGLLLQPQTANDLTRLGVVNFGGGVTIVPPAVNVLQSTMLGDIEGTLVVNRELDQLLDVNTGIYRPHFEKPPGNPETATGVQMRAAQATVLTNSAVNRFYQQEDRFLAEVYRRMSQPGLADIDDPAVKAARDFQRRVEKRGVSAEQMRSAIVRAQRTVGNGSPVMRQQVLGSLAAIAGELGPRGRRAWLEDFIAAHAGFTKVARYAPPEDELQIPTAQDREALQENASMMIGAPVVVTDLDDHAIHLGRHFEAAVAGISSVGQGADPMPVHAFVTRALQHAQAHLSLMKNERVRDAFAKQGAEIERALGGVQKQIEQQAQAQARGQQMTFEQQLAAQEAQAKIERMNTMNEARMRHREESHTQEMRIKDSQAGAEILRTAALTQAELRRGAAQESENARKKPEPAGT